MVSNEALREAFFKLFADLVDPPVSKDREQPIGLIGRDLPRCDCDPCQIGCNYPYCKDMPESK